MTVPVARLSARRTVRVAAALVAGQAVLVAVIGYVTLGGPLSRGQGAVPIVDPLAGSPLVVPAPTVPTPSRTTVAPAPPEAARSTTARAPATARSRHRPETTPAPPVEAPPDVLVATAGPSAGPSTDPTAVPPTAPSPDATPSTGSSQQPAPSPPPSLPTQQSVTIGDPCDPVDAPGVTQDGTAVLCVPDGDGVPRWQPA